VVAVELRNWIVPMMQCEMSIFELLRASSLRELAKKIVKKSKLVSFGDGPSGENTYSQQ
jgi:hypothetical protein